jgi:hypothetical protein
MTINQLSVFLENKSGRLTEVLSVLGEANIVIKALTIADTSEYGILRLIVSDSEKAKKHLKEKGFTVNITEVITLATPSAAGTFAKVLKLLSDEKISVEYMYAFSIIDKAIMVLCTQDSQKALNVLKKNSLEILGASDIVNF